VGSRGRHPSGIWRALVAAPAQPDTAGSLIIAAPDHAVSLEEQIDQWRSFLRRRQAIHSVDVAELEDHLREQVRSSSTPASPPTRRSSSR
jgi:hypothetical protein